jgi:predicted transcriptional regulator
MGEKIAKLGIKRDNDMMYYIKNGDVWATPRKKPGQPKGKAAKVAAAGIDMDYSKYLYYLDGDGDVARKERQVGGSKRKKSKAAPKKAKGKKPAKKTAKKGGKKGGGKKGKRK